MTNAASLHKLQPQSQPAHHQCGLRRRCQRSSIVKNKRQIDRSQQPQMIDAFRKTGPAKHTGHQRIQAQHQEDALQEQHAGKQQKDLGAVA